MGACCGPQAGVPPEPPSESEILEKLPSAEEKLWKIAFSQLDCDKSGNIAIENDLLRGL